MDKITEKMTEEIISMASDMNEEQREEFYKSVRDIIFLPGLEDYLESKASATFKI